MIIVYRNLFGCNSLSFAEISVFAEQIALHFELTMRPAYKKIVSLVYFYRFVQILVFLTH